MDKYKVYRVMKKTSRRYTQETGLTLSQAQRYIQNDIDNNGESLKSMLCFTKQ